MLWELIVNEDCDNYYYTNKTQLEKAESYLRKRNIPFRTLENLEVNRDFGKNFIYEVNVCLMDNTIIECELTYDIHVVEPYVVDFYSYDNEVFCFYISAKERMEEEELHMVFYTLLEDGIVDEKLELYGKEKEEWELKMGKLKEKYKDVDFS